MTTLHRNCCRIAIVLVLSTAACSFYANSAPTDYSPQRHGEPDCNAGRAATADTLAAIAGVGALIAGSVLYNKQCEGGSCDPDTKQTWQIGAAVPVSLIALGSAGAIVGMTKKSRCRAAKQRWFATDPQERERIRADRQREEDRKSGALRARRLKAMVADIAAYTGADVSISLADHLLLRVDDLSTVCTDLRWTEAVAQRSEALARLGIEKVSCIAGSLAVWTGGLDALPEDVSETRCAEYLEAAKAARSSGQLARVNRAIPRTCKQWAKAQWLEYRASRRAALSDAEQTAEEADGSDAADEDAKAPTGDASDAPATGGEPGAEARSAAR